MSYNTDLQNNNVNLQSILDKVNALPEAGGVVSSSWSRPWDWPNYDTMERPTSDVLYFTYDCRYGGYACFALNRGGVVSMGYIDNGDFIEMETEEFTSRTTYYKELSPDLGDYVVLRVTPLADSDPSKFELILTKPSTLSIYGDNACVETWGRMHDGKYMHYYVSNNGGVTVQTKAVTLYDFDFRGQISSFYNFGISLEFANLAEWGLVENTSYFSDCFRGVRLKEIIIPETWDLKSATNLSAMFRDCPFLTKVVMRNHNTEQVTNTSSMFQNSGLLRMVDLSGCNLSNVTNMNIMFAGCWSLIDVYIEDIPKSISFKDSENLSHDSLIRIINALTPVTETQTLTIGATNLAKLTEDEIAVATGKGWTVV